MSCLLDRWRHERSSTKSLHIHSILVLSLHVRALSLSLSLFTCVCLTSLWFIHSCAVLLDLRRDLPGASHLTCSFSCCLKTVPQGTPQQHRTVQAQHRVIFLPA